MPIPDGAIELAAPMDSREVLEYLFPMSPVLEFDEAIDPADWNLALLPEAVALGMEIRSGDPLRSDPKLVEENKTVFAWFSIDPAFRGNVAFQGGGAPMPMEVTLTTTAVEPRERQRTFVIRVKEQ